MSVHVQLAHLRPTREGVALRTIVIEVAGGMYTLPLPHQDIGHSAVVEPVIEPDEAGASVRIRLDQWRVRNPDLGLQLPIDFRSMSAAVRAGHEFSSDSRVSWDSDPVEIHSWALAWQERENIRDGGGQ